MSATAVMALVQAFDTLASLDGAAREDKVLQAQKILRRCPDDLPVEIAGRIREAGPKLASKLSRDSLSLTQKLAYVAAVAANGPTPPASDSRPSRSSEPAHGAEAAFHRAEVEEMRRTERAMDGSPAARRRREAIEAWRNSLGKLPTPWWALHGAESQSEYDRTRRAAAATQSIPAPAPEYEFVEDTNRNAMGHVLAPTLDALEDV